MSSARLVDAPWKMSVPAKKEDDNDLRVAMGLNSFRSVTVMAVTLTVQVSDNGPGTARTGSTSVADVNEFDPMVSGVSFSVAENSANEALVGSVSGADNDATNGGLSYSIKDGNGQGLFAINSSTGEITLADKSNLDREAIASVTLTVQVSDNGPGTARTGSTSVTINVTDVNEFDPVLNDDVSALNAIMAEWTSLATNYATRVAHLLNGGGANGSTRLNSTTIQNDSSAADKLTGGTAIDWFFQSASDVLLDYSSRAGEIRTAI